MDVTAPKYNHAYDFTFEVKTDSPAKAVTAAEIRAALLERANRLTDEELLEACQPYDSVAWADFIENAEIEIVSGINPDRWGPNGEDLFQPPTGDTNG